MNPFANFQISIRKLLLIGIGGTVTIFLVGIWSLLFFTGGKNVRDLLTDKAVLTLNTMEDQVARQMNGADRLVRDVAKHLEAKDWSEPTDDDFETLTLAQSGLPHITGLTLVTRSGRRITINRHSDYQFIGDLSDKEKLLLPKFFAGAEMENYPVWGQPFRAKEINDTLLNVRLPFKAADGEQALVVGVITLTELSKYLDRLELSDGVPFILYGKDKILAHPFLAADVSGFFKQEQTMLGLRDTGDGHMSLIWDESENVSVTDTSLINKKDVIRYVESFGQQVIFVYRKIDSYGEVPWYIGVYYRADQVNAELQRLWWAGGAGFIAILVVILCVMWVSSRIGKGVGSLSAIAREVENMNFINPGSLGRAPSIILEINDATRAFTNMMVGLRWFETYVPKRLVQTLIAEGGDTAAVSSERYVTVMFTDLSGFTTASEAMKADEIAHFLNHHFTIINRCIEDTDGTLDKYIGDGVMAFWGAPSDQPDHAERACKAAVRMRDKIRTENEERVKSGLPPVRMRIGIHSGLVIVGNIGAPGRVNYTMVGDTVNTASRLEQMGKEIAPEADVSILISAATGELVPDASGFEDIGDQIIRGREETLRVLKCRD